MWNAPLGRVQATIGNVLSPVGKALDKTLNVVAPLEFLQCRFSGSRSSSLHSLLAGPSPARGANPALHCRIRVSWAASRCSTSP